MSATKRDLEDGIDAVGMFEFINGTPNVKINKWLTKKHLYKHAKKHAAEFGIDYRSADGQATYSDMCKSIIESSDLFIVVDNVAGQGKDKCIVCIKDDCMAVVNTEKEVFVSAFKHKEGASEYYDRLWREAKRKP